MRTVTDIKREMTTAFMANEALASAYGFPVGAPFEDHFSKVSVESIIMYVVAFAIYTLERLFNIHSNEINELVAAQKPHTTRWYHSKILAFQYGRPLLPDSDIYDIVVEEEMIVKHAAVVEYQGKLFVKVAKGDTAKEPLNPDELQAIKSYMAEIKDAGVRVDVVSKPADHIAIAMNIYYDPMVLSSTGISLASGDDVVRNAISHYVEHAIPFDGQFRTIDLIDVLQNTPGVVIPELVDVRTVSHDDYESSTDDPPWVTVTAYHNPVSGYYKIYNSNDLQLEFIPYKTIEDDV